MRWLLRFLLQTDKIQRIQIKDDDIILFEIPDASPENVAYIHEYLKSIFTSQKVIILYEGSKFIGVLGK